MTTRWLRAECSHRATALGLGVFVPVSHTLACAQTAGAPRGRMMQRTRSFARGGCGDQTAASDPARPNQTPLPERRLGRGHAGEDL